MILWKKMPPKLEDVKVGINDSLSRDMSFDKHRYITLDFLVRFRFERSDKHYEIRKAYIIKKDNLATLHIEGIVGRVQVSHYSAMTPPKNQSYEGPIYPC